MPETDLSPALFTCIPERRNFTVVNEMAYRMDCIYTKNFHRRPSNRHSMIENYQADMRSVSYVVSLTEPQLMPYPKYLNMSRLLPFLWYYPNISLLPCNIDSHVI